MQARCGHRTLAGAVVLFLVGGLGVCLRNGPTRAAEGDANAAAPPAKRATNPVTRAAVDAGVLVCASRINQVADFLTANNQSGVYLFFPQDAPDRRLFSASFEIVTPNDATLYASASFAPMPDGGSAAVYDTVEYVATGAEELEKTAFKNLKRIAVLKKSIIVLDGGTVKVFLMPAGAGSVVIRKEVIQ